MIFFVFSILTNASIYLIFKWFDRMNIRVLDAIVCNYITAFTLGLLVVPDLHQATGAALQWPAWTVAGLVLGVVFISIFYLMAITAQKVGVSVTTIASKMSLALGVVLLCFLGSNEHLSALKVIAVVVALAGVVFASWKEGEGGIQWKYLFWPLIILLGSTVIDVGIAHYSTLPATDSENALFSCLSFGTAAVAGIAVIVRRSIAKGTGLRLRDVLAGVGLGVVNYGSIFFLVQSYNAGFFPKSTTLAVNNLAVVLIGAFGAALLFKERLSSKNKLGILLAVVAIVLLATEA
jgi:drug/metabolite transporter (DMT)-like permease